MQEKSKFGEQAINRIAEIALASQVKEADQLEVRVKTNLKQLARGEVESIAITINGLSIQPDLRAAELQLQIGRVTVKPFSAIRGKIHLVHPSEGTLQIVIHEQQLTDFLNSTAFREQLQHRLDSSNQRTIQVHQGKCNCTSDQQVAFQFDIVSAATQPVQTVAFAVTPTISEDRQSVILQNAPVIAGQEPPPELVAATIAQICEALSLHQFRQKGMSLQIYQLEVSAGNLTLQAAAHIEQFPSS